LRKLKKHFTNTQTKQTEMPGIAGHFWIENDAGEVIWDPKFDSYKLICKIRNADHTKPHYRKQTPARQREMMREHILPMMSGVRRAMNEGWVPPAEFWTPQSHNCASNTCRYKLNGGEGRICYGDMGWEQTDGKVWWEFEDQVSDEEYAMAGAIATQKALKNMTRKERRELAKKKKKNEKKNDKARAKYHEQMDAVPRNLGKPPMKVELTTAGKVLACGAVAVSGAVLASMM